MKTNYYLILDQEPFVGYMPNDLRSWLDKHHQEADIALAMMHVHNKLGMLMHECDTSKDAWLDYAYEEWYKLNSELILIISDYMNTRHEQLSISPPFKGSHEMIKPFMIRYGFMDASGWWRTKN